MEKSTKNQSIRSTHQPGTILNPHMLLQKGKEEVPLIIREQNMTSILTEKAPNSENESSEEIRRKRNSYKDLKFKEHSPAGKNEGQPKKYDPRGWMDSESARNGRRVSNAAKQSNSSDTVSMYESQSKRLHNTIELSREERAAKLHEMQMDAELNEEQRWNRLKKAEEDGREATRAHTFVARISWMLLRRSVYCAEKGRRGEAPQQRKVSVAVHITCRATSGRRQCFSALIAS